MNRRALLKGLGRAVAGLALLPLASLLPKASPLLKGEIGTSKGFVFHDELSMEDLTHLQMHMSRLMTYRQSTLYISSKPFKVRISGYVPDLSEEEVSKISRISL